MLLHSVYLLLATLAVAILTWRGRVHAFLALTLATAVFGFASGMSVSLVGKSFGNGFGLALNMPGLAVVAGGLVAAIAAHAGALWSTARLFAAWSGRRLLWVAALVGVLAGTAASPAAVLAALTPLRLAIRSTRPDRGAGALCLGLAVSAGHGLLLPSPVLIAAAAILGADWSRIAAFGVPAASLAAIVGALIARLACGSVPAHEAAPATGPRAKASAGAIALLTTTALLVVLSMIQSLGDIPSEPLGGGAAREMLLGIGRPAILLLLGVTIMVAATGQWRGPAPSSAGWAASAITRVAPLLLLIGASGGLQALAQNAHMAELIAERLLGWHAGLLVPFAVAATVKTLQGSSTVAAITAAGMVQPLLGSLGLDNETGRALAALAVGAGAITVAHINDPLFWLIADGADFAPARALKLVSGGTLLQAAAAMLLVMGSAALFD